MNNERQTHKMNCEQANKINIFDVLHKLGYHEQGKGSNAKEACFLSPFRKEAQGSFYVARSSGKWYDHGLAEGGATTVDFTVKYLASLGQNSSISNALKFLKSYGYGAGDTKPLFISDSINDNIHHNPPKELELIRVKPVTHKAIFQYMKNERGIPEHLVSKYLVEVQYRNTKLNKVFFGMAIQNQSGKGYEVRSASTSGFKTALGAKDISIIKGANKERRIINVFEGFTDFLSLLCLLNTDQLNGDSLILNSLSCAKKAITYIRDHEFENVNLFLDNDDAGIKMSSRFAQELSGEVLDQSGLYGGYKDVNKAYVAQIDEKAQFDFRPNLSNHLRIHFR